MPSRRPNAGPQPQQGQVGAASGLEGGGAANIEIENKSAIGIAQKDGDIGDVNIVKQGHSCP